MRSEAARLALRVYHRLWTPRIISWRGVRLWIPRGVFSPLGTVSTDLLAGLLEELGPRGRMLDIGCGGGALSILWAVMGGEAVCYEPSPEARVAAALNAGLNGVAHLVHVVGSPSEAAALGPYALVATNPPYLPLDPRDDLDALWCAGRNLEVLHQIGALARRAAPRALYAAVLSSLTPPERGVKALHMAHPHVAARRQTVLDKVYALLGIVAENHQRRRR